MKASHIEQVHQSLKRCNGNPRFLDVFYETFLSASPAIAEKFADTEMTRQKRMVEASLYTSILAAEGVPYAVSFIKRLGEKHRDLPIGPALYELWLDSLLQTVSVCDEAFNEQVEAAWRAVLRRSIETMLATYEMQD